MTSNSTSSTGRGRLAGKVCLITGGGSGFGAEMGRTFTKEGAKVVLADLNPITAAQVEKEIQSAHGEDVAISVQADVTSHASWENLLKRTLEAFGQLDVVVNNAGTTYPKKASHTVTEGEWDKVINVNIKSIFLSTAVVMPYWIERRAGVMLNTSSVGGIRVKNGLVFQLSSLP